MNGFQKVSLSLYALLYSLTALVGFRFSIFVPDGSIYVLISGLFIILVVVGLETDISPPLAAVLVTSLAFLLGLLVVDPLEVGFYGYDPYSTLRALIEFRKNGLVWLANERGAWPGFYAFTWSAISLLGQPPAIVGKYLPMIAVLIPLACYIVVRRFANRNVAFIAAVGVTGIRTLVSFEMKFVDESLAATLFFVLLAVLAIEQGIEISSRKYNGLVSLLAVVAILTHHYLGLLVVLLLCFWTFSQRDFFSRLVPTFKPDTSTGSSTQTAAIIASITFIVILLVLANSFAIWILGAVNIDVSTGLSGGSGNGSTTQPAVSEGGGEPLPFAQSVSLVRYLHLLIANLVIGALFAVVAISFLRDRHYDREIFALAALGGVLTALYAWSIAFGRIVPLDPSRYLLYMVAIGLFVAAARLHRHNSDILYRLFGIVVVAVAITQLSLLPTAVWYSDQADTIVGEDHYSPSQFAASEWYAEYGGDTITGWESGVWLYNNISMSGTDPASNLCEGTSVWRSDIDRPRPASSIIYDSGSIALFGCPN